MQDRASGRQKLVALMQTIADFQAVYDHQTLDFGDKSPVCMVFSDGTTDGPAVTAAGSDDTHAYAIEYWWTRDLNTASATEASMDALTGQIRALLKRNRGANGVWQHAKIDGFSQPDNVILDSKQFRRERIRVVAW